jgi:hypothetical protein
VDKCNIERMNESADVQQKLGMLGKSASRHLDHLKSRLQSEVQTLLDLMKKSSSVAFNAFRDDGCSDGGESYVTFSGCTVNIGNGMIPKSGIFQAPVPGTYMFTLTVCTFDGKKCLLFLRKNQKDVCAMIDQDGNENRGKTMITQTCMMELEIGERVQVYAVTGTGFTDLKSSHYTQFSGLLVRPSADMFDEAAKLTCGEDDELSIRESFRGFTPTPMDIERRAASRQSVSRRSVEPPPVPNGNGATMTTIPMPTSVPIPQSIPLPVLKKDVKTNNAKSNITMSPEPVGVPQKMNGSSSNGVQSNEVPAGASDSSASEGAPNAKERTKKKKEEQSYLALTGLGGAEAKPQEQKPPQRKQESKSFYSFLTR